MKTLKERIWDAKNRLDRAEKMLMRDRNMVSVKTLEHFQMILDSTPMEGWVQLLEARDMSEKWLRSLATLVDNNDQVQLGVNKMSYQHARFIGFQSWISTTWALADTITKMVGKVVCTSDVGKNDAMPARLLFNFIGGDRTKTVMGGLCESMEQFGWPVAMSYATRNFWIHAGSLVNGQTFFEGLTSTDGFRIATVVWTDLIKKAAKEYEVDSSHCRGLWGFSKDVDALDFWSHCTKEMDVALGILLASACGSIEMHVGFMLGQDD